MAATPANTTRRQIELPLSKAIEIAYNSIRLRFTRSLLVTSSIVLALAFLCSILLTQTLLDGMRHWAETWPQSADFSALKQRREKLDIDIDALTSVLRFSADKAQPAANAVVFDPKAAFGEKWEDIKADTGALPLSSADLTKLLTASPDRVGDVKKLIDLTRQRRTAREQLNRPEALRAAMTTRGVPVEPADIAADRLQTRWVIGLALLVAFVGILNAMLMSVTERFREIGTMKCLGALDSFIVKLFLLESLFQGVVGTAAGILVGVSVSFISATISYGGATFYHLLTGQIFWNLGITLVVGMALSVGGAILPALQAARMEPIAAMRVEA